MRRRAFIQSVAGGAMAAMPVAAASAQAGPAGRLRLGFDSFTLNGYGWTAIQYLDYAAKVQIDIAHLSDAKDYQSFEPAYLAKVKDHAERLGVQIDGGLGCMCPDVPNYVTPANTAARKAAGATDPVDWVRRCLRANKAVGAKVMRAFLGGGGDRGGPIEKHIETCVKILRAVRTEAMDLGMKIGMENHGDLQAWEMRELIEAAGKDFVGSCLDTGNSFTVAEDPMVTLETLGPYCVLTHIKDTVVYEHPRGAAVQGVALGDGTLDHVKFFDRFRQLCPDAPVNLEISTGGAPRVMPYLEPDFWKPFPKARAPEFAQFVALVKRGQPYMGSMMIAGRDQRPPEYAAAAKEQKRVDLERSLDYAKKVLKIGVRA